MRVSGKEPSGGGNEREVGGGKECQNKIVNNGHVVGSGMVLEASLIFMQGHITRIVQGVFDPPVRAQHREELGG